MRKSKAETAETRRRIVQAATRAFRSNGIQATGVAEIMSAAGLSHGGFYRHFASKEHLVAEAFAAGMASTLDALDDPSRSGEQAFMDHFGTWLGDKTRTDGLGECPLIAMGSELARADSETRRAATRGYLDLIETMAIKGGTDIRAAIFAFSAILGAVTVSRIVDDPELAGQVLAETRKGLLGMWPGMLPEAGARISDASQIDGKAEESSPADISGSVS